MAMKIFEYPEELRSALLEAHGNRFSIRNVELIEKGYDPETDTYTFSDCTKALITVSLGEHDYQFAAKFYMNAGQPEDAAKQLSEAMNSDNLDGSSVWATVSVVGSIEFWLTILSKRPTLATATFHAGYGSRNVDVLIHFIGAEVGKASYGIIDFDLGSRLSARDSYNLAGTLAHGPGYGFEWPDTQVDKSKTDLLLLDAPEEGYLKYLGYTVGESGAAMLQRRHLLTKAFESELPDHFSAYEKAQWGQPSTCSRLKKIAYSIAAFTKLKRRVDMRREQRQDGKAYVQAIRDWEEDLSWLKHEFYAECRARFTWPHTNLH